MVYKRFISYSHAADGQLAPALQRGLRHLAKPRNRRRALNIFPGRDRPVDEPAPVVLSPGRARRLGVVLLASPEAAASEWVNREIEHWLATKSAAHILPVVTDGTWTWGHLGSRLLAGFNRGSTRPAWGAG